MKNGSALAMTRPRARNWTKVANTVSKSRSAARFKNMELNPRVRAAASSSLDKSLGCRTGRVDQQGHDRGGGDQFVQQFQSLWRYLHVQLGRARDVGRPVGSG